jgi:hypothetical protein
MNAEAEEKPDFFEKLADSLYSWRIEISRNKKIRSLAQWDIVLQTSENLKTATTWLEWQKGFDYAEGFKRKFQSLYNDVKNFYKKLEQGEMDEEEIFHEQIPILEDSAKKLAEYVLTVKYLCQNDRQIQEITKTEPAEAEQKATATKEEKGNMNVVNISANKVQVDKLQQSGHDSYIHEQTATASIGRSIWTCIKKIPRWIYYILGALAALLAIFNHLGWI